MYKYRESFILNKTGRGGVQRGMKVIRTVVAILGVGMVMGSPLPEKAELLAVNRVLAEYEGTHFHPCRHMTAECPDRCDHATHLAHFKVVMNMEYKKLGKYGDDKMTLGETAFVDVQKDVPGQENEVAKVISRLQLGETVELTINHYYVQQGQSYFPVRPVVHIAPLRSEPSDVEKERTNDSE